MQEEYKREMQKRREIAHQKEGREECTVRRREEKNTGRSQEE
jgi:hypothetical protein